MICASLPSHKRWHDATWPDVISVHCEDVMDGLAGMWQYHSEMHVPLIQALMATRRFDDCKLKCGVIININNVKDYVAIPIFKGFHNDSARK